MNKPYTVDTSTRPQPSEDSTPEEKVKTSLSPLQVLVTAWALAHMFRDLISFIHWCVNHFKFVP